VILNGVDEVEATGKLEGGNCTNVSVAVKMKFDPKKMLEEIPVGTRLKWWEETGSRDDAQSIQNGCILAGTVYVVLDHHMRDAVRFGSFRCANNHLRRLVIVEAVIITSETERVIRLVAWLPDIRGNWLGLDNWWRLQDN
jgi:hypothetical protein